MFICIYNLSFPIPKLNYKQCSLFVTLETKPRQYMHFTCYRGKAANTNE
jgi:hypothetical protein